MKTKSPFVIGLTALFLVTLASFDVKDNKVAGDFCCCKYQNPVSNPAKTATNYAWMTKKDCADIFMGKCTTDTEKQCKDKK